MVGKHPNVVWLVLGLCMLPATAWAVEFSLVPADATLPHIITGNEIRVPAGARVYLEMYVSDWDPDLDGDPLLRTMQVDISPLGYTSGDSGSLVPPVVSCQSDQDCVDAGLGSSSPPTDVLCDLNTNECKSYFIDQDEAAASPCNFDITACNTNSRACGATMNQTPPCVDTGALQYIGTVALDISVDATGVFTLEYVSFFALDQFSGGIPVTGVFPALITIGDVEGCCLPTGGCQFGSAAECAALGGALGSPCSGDNDSDGIDDSCQADCDGDLVPDIDESNAAEKDCDLDGTCNGDEIGACAGDPACADCNANNIPDGCEQDCNQNNVPDDCDISSGTSQDCNNNNFPDDCETDCNNNNLEDSCDIANLTSEDCDANGVPDECQQGGCCLDDDMDGTYEACAFESLSFCDQANGIFRGPCKPCPEQNADIVPEPGGEVFVHVIGPPIDCMADTSLRAVGCSPTGPFSDVWKSDADGAMCHNFGATGHTIPAGFFNTVPDSDAFVSSVCVGRGAARCRIRRGGHRNHAER